jgi:hypothetical protein
MRKQALWRSAKFVLLLIAIISGGAATAAAETSTSPHYQVTGTDFNAVSNSQACSSQYCAKASIGNMSADVGKSATSTARFGSIAATDSNPLLEVIVDPGVSNLGTLTTENTAFKSMTVRVRTHLSDGYVLQIVGNPPKYGGHTLTTSTTPTSALPGTEQFGINATTNTSPGVGADPLQVPSSQTSFGVVNDDYKIQNKFKYINGEGVARSNSESGRTDYTISMIVNISNATPAGHYTGDFSAVVVPLY